MPLTADWAGRLLRATFAGDALPAFTATKISLGLSTTVPTETTACTPISGDPRVGPNQWTNAETANGATRIANVDAFSFTNMPAVTSPTTIRYYDVYDSPTSGSPIRKAYGELASPRNTVSGDTLTVAANAFSQAFYVARGSTQST